MESGENKEEQNEQKREEYEEKNLEEETEEKVKTEGEKEKQEIEEKGKEGKREEEKKKEEKPKAKFLSSEWYNKNYKFLLAFSLLLFIAALAYLVVFYTQHGDFMYKDVSLTGGTTITVYASEVDINKLESFLKDKTGQEAIIRKLEDITSRKTIAFVVETQAEADETKKALEDYLKYELTSENSSIESSGPSLAKSFYNQLLLAILIAFLFMSIAVFLIFRTFIPSLAIILAAATDIVCALALINLLGFRVSTAGIAAFLMLIGYSVDTDAMLTTKVIKRRGEGTVNSRIKSAFKTGVVMTLTSLAAVLVGYFIAQASVLKEIFFVLSCGLFFDLLSTWLGNAAIVKWYCEKKKIS